MLRSTISVRRFMLPFLAASCVAIGVSFSTVRAASIAVTNVFNANADGIPVDSNTIFYDPLWSDGDPLNTAEHELFHAIGFTANYVKFAAHIRPALTPPLLNAGDRPFNSKTDGTGDTLALLIPTTTHVDPAAGTVNGRDQADSIMQPTLVNGQRLANWEAAILNAAFGWNTLNIKITVDYVTPFTAAQKTSISGAVAAVQTLFGSDGTGHAFTWKVSVTPVSVPPVPEPNTIVLLGMGTVFVVGLKGRKLIMKPTT